MRKTSVGNFGPQPQVKLINVQKLSLGYLAHQAHR